MDAVTLPQGLPGTPVEVQVWAPLSEVEHGAQRQLRNVASLPWVRGVRAMADIHQGYGVPIGSVIAMEGAVSPAAVGVDIGCGVAAVKTSLTLADLPDDLHPIRLDVEASTPLGFHSHRDTSPVLGTDAGLGSRFASLFGRFKDLRADRISDRESRAASQCGTLGGGNHFIELCVDDEDAIWLTLHSGSRNVGKEIAERHVAKAKHLDHNLGLVDSDLAVFVRDTPLWDDYLHDLWWAQDYAALNREVMLAAFERVIERHFPHVRFTDRVNAHHNYVSLETYDDVELVITRKGAISARAGQLGLIPGSMGTGSFIVAGLGNAASYNSASHGAGRQMSRNKARKLFSLEDLAAQTAGIECRKDAGVLDEAPGAYKDIVAVIENQKDLVVPVARLHTLLCVKG